MDVDQPVKFKKKTEKHDNGRKTTVVFMKLLRVYRYILLI